MDEAVRLSGRTVAPGEAHGSADLLSTLVDATVVIRSGRQMGLLLWMASPGQARRFALDSHERACERADDDVTAFWRETLDWLSGRESGTGDAAVWTGERASG